MNALLLAPLIAPISAVQADERLHRVETLELGIANMVVEHETDFAGTLYVWVSSETADPMFWIEDPTGEVVAEDRDSGGGTRAWTSLDVEPRLALTVHVSVESDSTGPAELHFAAAPEADGTRAAAERADTELEAIEALRGERRTEEARQRTTSLVENLLAVDGGRTSRLVNDALRRAGTSARRLFLPRVAIDARSAVLAFRRRVMPPEHRLILSAMQSLAAVHHDAEEYERARELEESVLAARERTLPAEHADVLSIRNNLGTTLFRLGDLAGAGEQFRAVHEVRERLLEPDDPQLLAVKQNLAMILKRSGDLVGARELEEHVFAVRVRTFERGHRDLLGIQENLAVTRAQLGDLAGARELMEPLVAELETIFPADHPYLIQSKSTLAAIRLGSGDDESAAELLRQVHDVLRERVPLDHPMLVEVRGNLASAYRGLDRPELALELEEDLFDRLAENSPPEDPKLLNAKNNLALSLQRAGQGERALRLLTEVHEVRSQTLPDVHPDLARAKTNLAAALYRNEDFEGALELYREAHAAVERSAPRGDSARRDALQNLALVHATRLDVDEFEEVVGRLLEEQRDRAEELRWLAPRTARVQAAIEVRRLSSVLSWMLAEPLRESGQELLPAAWSVLETLRAAGSPSVGASHVAAPDAEHEELRAELLELGRTLSNTVLAVPSDAAAVEDWRRRVFELSDRRDRVRTRLAERTSELGFPVVEPTIAAVARRLERDGGAWVSFLRGPLPPPDSDRPGLQVDSFLALVVRPDGGLQAVELGPAVPVEDAIHRWRSAIGTPVSSRGVTVSEAGSPTEERAAGAALRRLVLDPILRVVEDGVPLHLVLDDVLHLVPFDALPVEDGRLGDVRRVRVRTDVARFLEDPPPHPAGELLLAVGGIDYDADGRALRSSERGAAPPVELGETRGDERAGPSGSFARLRGTGEEVRFLEELRRDLEGEAVVLSGSDATKAALLERLPRARWLHLATHGWFAPESVRSALDRVEAASGREGAPDGAEVVLGFAPGTLCGLALAGANRGVDERGLVPGILTAEELATVDLSGCELAVLSACETNVGIRRAGLGIQSLQTALRAAGARAAVTSLWKVDDEATRELMERFYTYLWVDRVAAADALWRAKCDLRAAGHPPRNWAGWVVTGSSEPTDRAASEAAAPRERPR